MKLVLVIAAAIGLLMLQAIYDAGLAHKAKEQGALFGCRAPIAEGDITMITIDVRDGKLIGDCQYATTRKSKSKTKGG